MPADIDNIKAALMRRTPMSAASEVPTAPAVQGICPCGCAVLEGTPVVLSKHGFRYCQSCLDKGMDKQLEMPRQGMLDIPER